MSSQVLVNTSLGGKAWDDGFKHFVCLKVYFVQPSVQLALGQEWDVHLFPCTSWKKLIGQKKALYEKWQSFFLLNITKRIICCFYSIFIEYPWNVFWSILIESHNNTPEPQKVFLMLEDNAMNFWAPYVNKTKPRTTRLFFVLCWLFFAIHTPFSLS